MDDIRRAVEDIHLGSGSERIDSIRIDENKENVIFLCETHLDMIVIPEMDYDCTPCKVKDFYFISVDKRFCTGCVRHFCQKFTFLFPFVDFSLIDFCVNSSSSA